MSQLQPYQEQAIVLSETIPLDQHPAAVYLAGLSSENSRNTMRRSLEIAAGVLLNQAKTDGRHKGKYHADILAVDWSRVRFQHLSAIKATLVGQEYKPATINKILAAVRGVLRAAKALGLITIADYDQATSEVKPARGETLPAGRDLSDTELRKLFTACARDPKPATGIRDAAILSVLYMTPRVSEVVRLQVSDFEPDAGRLTVTGKGGKERIVPIKNGYLDALKEWLAIRGDQPGPLFLAINKGGVIQPKGITRQAIFKMCQKRGNEAEIAEFSPHDFRRTVIGDLLDQGSDISTIQKIAGHASPVTTARYDRRPEQKMHEAISSLRSFYVPPRKKGEADE